MSREDRNDTFSVFPFYLCHNVPPNCFIKMVTRLFLFVNVYGGNILWYNILNKDKQTGIHHDFTTKAAIFHAGSGVQGFSKQFNAGNR